jgi:hypothetical protein
MWNRSQNARAGSRDDANLLRQIFFMEDFEFAHGNFARQDFVGALTGLAPAAYSNA